MVFKGQTITLALDTDVDLTGFTGVIRYKKPNRISGEWAGSIVNDTVTYDIDENDIDVAGVWMVQAKATMGAEVKYGKTQAVEFRTPL